MRSSQLCRVLVSVWIAATPPPGGCALPPTPVIRDRGTTESETGAVCGDIIPRATRGPAILKPVSSFSEIFDSFRPESARDGVAARAACRNSQALRIARSSAR
ncbi:hypothetical protein AAFF_G00389920 [Aldrovandia affinis]|uniref:Secreted protein n=1 Tax=Aldrovandia affinis TaxID=143900 RepID=A0AAD7SEJ0_9TELE|nr:hypothetical protein AAFF_G00389920 [Aldrovandia affinis]